MSFDLIIFCSLLDFSFSINKKDFPVYNHLSFLWSMGFLLLFSTLIQIVSGIFLSFNMKMGINDCLSSKMSIFLNVNNGWVIVNLHTILPSFMFFLLYIHMLSSFIYPIYYYHISWLVGFIIYLIYVFVSFTGYALVSGSMGYWAMVVVQGLMSYVGGDLLGDLVFCSLDMMNDSVMMKMFTYHYLFGLVMLFFIFMHMIFNHSIGPSSTTGSLYMGKDVFMILFLGKDFNLLVIMNLFISSIIFFYPEYYYSLENFMEMGDFVFLEEINAEWYLSLLFVMLKMIQTKMIGVFCMCFSIFMIYIKYFIKGLLGFQVYSVMVVGFLFFMMFFVIVISYYSWGFVLYNKLILIFLSILVFIDLFEFDNICYFSIEN